MNVRRKEKGTDIACKSSIGISFKGDVRRKEGTDIASKSCTGTDMVLSTMHTEQKCLLTLRRLTSYIYGAPILDVSRSHTTTQHSR